MTVEFRCECGHMHTVQVDATGQWVGACDKLPGKVLRLQIDGNEWRRMQAEEALKVVH